MKNQAKHLIIFLLVALLGTVGAVISSHARQASKGGKGGQTIGWCCKSGKTVKTTAAMCSKQKGHFFATREAAESYCDAQTPGYCCLNGKVVSSNKGNCLKNKGHFFKKKNAADLYCEMSQPGYCCIDHKVSKMKKGECLKKKGKFFTDKTKATSACELKGWCLLNNRIFEITRRTCLTRRGRFFAKKTEAQKALRLAKQKQKLSPGPGTPEKPALFPLLSVEKIYLKDGIVHLRVRNKGKGKFTRGHYDKGRLMLSLGAKNKTWSLSRIDPKGALNKGKYVEFDTGFKLTRRAKVQVSTAQLPSGKSKTSLLTPSERLKQKTASTFSTGHTKKTPVSPLMMAKRAKPSPPSMVPMILDRGIHILNPVGPAKYYQGETIHIIYEITREDVSDGDITFSVLSRTGTNAGTITVPAHPGVPALLTLREDTPIGRYYISASHSASDAYGESDEFQITRNLARIDFLEPSRDDVQHTGGTMTVRYQFNRRVEPGTITFQLYHNGSVEAEQTQEYLPEGAGTMHQAIHTLHFEIPSGISYGNYTILATHPKASGFVTFPIRPIGEGGASEGGGGTHTAWEIRLVTPGHTPISWPRGSTQIIAWRINGHYPAERAFLVQLKRGADTVLTIPAERAIWHGASESYSLSWPIPADLSPASDYRIKVVDRNGPTEGISETFSVTGPIKVMHGGGVRYIANPTVIRFQWPLEHSHTGVRSVRISVVDESGTEVMVLSRNQGVFSGNEQRFTWNIGGNRVSEGQWIFHGEEVPLHGGSHYAIRVSDTSDPSNYGLGSYFEVRYAGFRVWTNTSGCRHGRQIHWESPLDASVRVSVVCLYVSGNSSCGAAQSFFHEIMRYCGEIWISYDQPPSGSLCWRFGESSSGGYPYCSCFTNDRGIPANIVVYPNGFRNYVYGLSSMFHLPDRGCRR